MPESSASAATLVRSAVLALLAIGAAFAARPQPDPASPDEPSAEVADAKPLRRAPLAYFENHCARCHGRSGSLYPRRADWDIDQLKEKIELMSVGPANAPIKEGDLDVQAALHIAFMDKAPFIAWLGRNKDGALIGEVTPGVELTAESEGKALTVTRAKLRWTIADAPEGKPVTLRAGSTTLIVPRQAFAPALPEEKPEKPAR